MNGERSTGKYYIFDNLTCCNLRDSKICCNQKLMVLVDAQLGIGFLQNDIVKFEYENNQ